MCHHAHTVEGYMSPWHAKELMGKEMEKCMKAKDFFASTLAREHCTHNVNTGSVSWRPVDIFIELNQRQREKDHLQFNSELCSGDEGKPCFMFNVSVRA